MKKRLRVLIGGCAIGAPAACAATPPPARDLVNDISQAVRARYET